MTMGSSTMVAGTKSPDPGQVLGAGHELPGARRRSDPSPPRGSPDRGRSATGWSRPATSGTDAGGTDAGGMAALTAGPRSRSARRPRRARVGDVAARIGLCREAERALCVVDDRVAGQCQALREGAVVERDVIADVARSYVIVPPYRHPKVSGSTPSQYQQSGELLISSSTALQRLERRSRSRRPTPPGWERTGPRR